MKTIFKKSEEFKIFQEDYYHAVMRGNYNYFLTKDSEGNITTHQWDYNNNYIGEDEIIWSDNDCGNPTISYWIDEWEELKLTKKELLVLIQENKIYNSYYEDEFLEEFSDKDDFDIIDGEFYKNSEDGRIIKILEDSEEWADKDDFNIDFEEVEE